MHYPPLYPMLLAPFFGVLSVNAAALAGKLLNALLAAAAAGLIAWHAVRTQLLGSTVPRWLAPVIVGGAAIAIPVLATQSVLFAEPLFGVLLAIVIIAADQGASPWMVGTAAALALLTRSIAVALIAGVVCFLLARRVHYRRLAGVVVPVLVAALLWGKPVAFRYAI